MHAEPPGRDGRAPSGTVGVALWPGVGVGLAYAGRLEAIGCDDPASVVADLEARFAPRWTWWGRDTADALVDAGVQVTTCRDVGAVQQLLDGGGREPTAGV